ncbi:lactonase family protein [Xylocopilactobacillus apis]|uniref:6-phosphogluconolactonase n=1 Tax=Xylocopilactobacillus apis TaxID=2932183 RepID=A0AAU9CVE9_9LACO|nr:lactonase family protein [Xylocopilactobacillus apis]BDR56361.1 6-phosphogluconolactonase [Xylocopilactobacillus apis]
MNIITGGYTKKNSQGIYISKINMQTYEVSDPSLLIKIDNPTYLVIFDETIISILKNKDQGGIACFKKQGENFKKVSEYVKDQTPPAYVAVNKEHNLIFDANYHAGTVNLYSLSNDGKIDLLDSYTNHGKGIKDEQDSSHFHYIDLTPDEKLISCDLGTDEIILFETSNKKLSVSQKIKVDPGFGPRHIIFNPNGNYFYCIGELGSEIKIFSYGEQIEEIESYPTIPAGYDGHNGASAIKISKDGTHLYAANRGFNSIIVFEVKNNGAKLKEIQNISTEGDFPRDFAINDHYKLLFVGNQNTDNGTLFKILDNGSLKIQQKNIKLHEPTFVEFFE